jgi:acyl-CoA synthetase
VDFTPRLAPEHLRRRYEAEGLWTDDSFSALTAAGLAANGSARARVLSGVHPYDGTVGELGAQGERLAALLARRGYRAGDVIAFQLPNWAEAPATFYGLLRLGAVSVPIVHVYGRKEVGHILRQSRARVLITADRFGREDFLANLDAELRAGLPDLELVIVVEAHGDAPRLRTPESLTWDDVLAADAPAPPVARVHADSPLLIAYTSGTTSAAKGVVHTHRSMLAELRQMALHRSRDASPAPSVTPLGSLNGSPVGHMGGMLAMFAPLMSGSGLHFLDRWDAAIVLEAMREGQLSSGSGATFFLNSLIDHPDFDPAVHVPLMAQVGLGGSSIPPEIVRRCASLGISVSRSYGSTELPSISMTHHSDPERARVGTDGRLMPGVEVRLVDDAGGEVPSGEPGEILARGAELFAGYVDAALTTATFDAEGWFATGDIGVFDEHGFLTITDRKKDIIIRGGENISAAEVEEIIVRAPGVFEAAVVAAPDERYGEHACAFVQLGDGGRPFELADLRVQLQSAGLARQKWPEELRFVDDFPRTASGKVQKHVLRDQLRGEVAEKDGRT